MAQIDAKKVTPGCISIVAICLIIFILMKACESNPVVINPDTVASNTEKQSLTTQADNKNPNWDYSEDEDAMDNKKEFFAESKSLNVVDFQFPYEGGSTFILRIQYRKGKNDVILQVSKGQFLTEVFNEKTIRVKFDNEKPFRINIGGTSDGRSDVIFLYPASKLISKLRKANSFMVEPEFFESGYKQIEFDVEGLQWKH